jgi:two-component system OmpR family response regulator
MRLLLVEDDTMLAQATADAARQNAWQLDHAPDAASARIALLGHSYDAVVLDLGLPGACGLTVLRTMRSRFDPTPVLILTARGQLSERIAGLDAGADDYLTKPFQFDELWARIRAVTRRSRNEVVPILSSKDIRVDVSKRIVTRAGEPVTHSAHEFRTLVALLQKPGQVLTRDYLQDVVYGGESAIESNTIAVYIHQLRRKLGEGIIQTVHGHGYLIGDA